MKRIMSSILATGLVLGLSANAFAVVKRPVIDIDQNGYVTVDGVVNLDDAINKVQGGKTVYFPLLSGESSDIAALKAALNTKKAELQSAEATLQTALANKNIVDAELKKLQSAYDQALAAYNAAIGNTKQATPTLEQLQQQLKTAKDNLAAKESEITAKQKEIDEKQVIVTNLTAELKSATDILKAHVDFMESFEFVKNDADFGKLTGEDRAKKLNELFHKAIVDLGGTVTTIATTELKTTFDPLFTMEEYNKLDNVGKAAKLNSLLADLPQKKAVVADKTPKLDEEKKAFEVLQTSLTDLKNEKIVLEKAVADAQKALESNGDVTEMKAKVDAAEKALNDYKNGDAYKNAINAHNTALAAVDTAKAAVKTAEDNLSKAQATSYKYVNESDAVSRTSITSRWEIGKQYVGKTNIIKKKTNYSYSDISEKYAYFVALETKPTNSTSDKELVGEIRLRKTGTDAFDLTLNVGMELGYSQPEQDSVIGTSEQVFEVGAGFTGDYDDVLEFEADPYSRFEVNTTNQDRIVLSMDCKYDSDIAAAFPTANIDFWNGNYATFYRMGKLYLNHNDSGDGYLYSIGKDGKLSTQKYTFDKYEDCYVIDTRVLGRYMISDKKLDITKYNAAIDKENGSSSSSSSSSSSNNGNVKPNPPTGAIA